MEKGLREKIAKAIASGTDKHGKLPQSKRKPKCVVPDNRSDVKCSEKIDEEVVTSVGS